MMNLGSSIVSASCLFRRAKETEVFTMQINANPGLPLARVFFPMDSRKSRRIAALDSSVMHVLSSCAFAKIFSPVIKRVMVPVIALFSFFAAKNFTMHAQCCAYRLCLRTHRIKTARMLTPCGAPIPAGEPLKIFNIYNRNFSLRERDEPERLVERLNHRMAFHAFFHRCTSNALDSAAF